MLSALSAAAALPFSVFKMNNSYKIKKGLEKVGKEVFLADGEWNSTPFYAVVEQRWKSNKTDFEARQTMIGNVSTDFFTYIGPSDHDIMAVSDDGWLMCDGEKYIFKKKEKVSVGGYTQYYWGILRRVWEEEDD